MKKDRNLIILFLVIIFAVFICIPSKYVLVHLNILSLNRDNLKEYQSIEENNIIDRLNNIVGRVENKVENTVTNYFPFYNGLNGVYQNISFYANKLIYEDVPIKTNSDGEYIFYNKSDDFYYLKTKYTNKELNERLSKQIMFFNGISDVSEVYVYIPTRYELTGLKNNSLEKYVEMFKDGVSEDINVAVMDVKDIDAYKKYFYKTDHHWNINGALDAYYCISSLMGFDALDNLNVVEKRDRKFYGSLAKSSLNDITYDYISDVDIELDYDVYINGGSDKLFKPREIRLDRSYKYYDYYVSYFNGQYGNIVYDYKNEEKENILILGDSYVWGIDYLIASSFNKTHVINLRYDEYKNNLFNLRDYVKDNNISKVLFLYEGGSVLFDQYDYNFLGRVK